jgi:DNA-binding MarR family transcriptional regulator/predicted N-acetyltransferase YhbS
MDQIASVRSFNRAVTRRIGALEDRFLGRDRPLGASRVLFEVGREGVALAELRARLGLDSGYLSRLLRSLEGEGLIEVRADPADRRARRAVATPAGLEEIADLDRLSDDGAASLLAPLSEGQRDRLVAAMAEVERLLAASATTIDRVDPASAEARWCVEQYFAELGERFEEGFDARETAPADADELVPPRGVFLVAHLDGRAVGCGAVKTWTPGVADIKRMWVAPEVRGSGLGRRMLVALEGEARALGLGRARLETNGALAEALAMYRSHGYRPIDPYSGDPYAHFAFERELRLAPDDGN